MKRFLPSEALNPALSRAKCWADVASSQAHLRVSLRSRWAASCNSRCDFVDEWPHSPRAGAIMGGLDPQRRSSTPQTSGGGLPMKMQFALAVVVVAAVAAPVTAQAQGIIGGSQHGVAVGQR